MDLPLTHPSPAAEASPMNGRILHCDLHLPEAHHADATIEIKDGLIEAIHSGNEGPQDSPVLFDAEGQTTMPGFIDIHTHGADGRDVCDGKPGALETIGRAKIREGVTTFLPTTLTIPREDLVTTASNAAGYMAKPTFAKAPALHIEGPFINPQCVGAQNPAHVRLPDASEIRELHAIAPIGLVSLAPEMEGGLSFIEEMKAQGITTSLAHTAATYAEFQQARNAGAKHLTHYCNQMTGLHHREIGLVGAALLDDDVMIELICDRIHLCPEMIELVFKHRSLDQLMLVTDSVAASWMPDGTIELGGLTVHVKDGAARLESGALAGSTLRYHQAVRNVAEITGIGPGKLSKISSRNQAQSLGIPGGNIAPGAPADLVILDETYKPVAVFVDGVDKLPAA